MAYTLDRNTKRTVLIALAMFALFAGFAGTCGEGCIERNSDGVCISTASDIVEEPVKIWNEVSGSVSGSGTGNVLDGGHGRGVCVVAGVNCD